MNSIRRLITKIAIQWLERHGHTVVGPCFTGVVLGYCYAIGDKEKMVVMPMNPHSTLIVLNHTYVDTSKKIDFTSTPREETNVIGSQQTA
jgi:hypothetical protein